MIISREKLSLSNQISIIIAILYWTYKIAVYIGHFIKNTVIYITNRKLEERFELEINLVFLRPHVQFSISTMVVNIPYLVFPIHTLLLVLDQ